ncbi:CLUMA_CG016485, isoform A [Clunio marinus]|uniref:CLUMA_CG016485, isoform A n=1 Tax=Clunio marinus TaxID=568069 RepID=A0A1J1ISH3_9DIPT|nr:CLUMA_CG016485, isoform A [Clunio marinus]
MKNIYGLSSKPSVKSPVPQGYLGYLTQKQLQQLNKSKLKSPNPIPQYQSSSSVLMKKKPFDYTDHHYRDTIGRLKLMLADVYSPTKYSSSSSIFKSVTDDETDTTENTIVERSVMKDVSKYYPYKPYSTVSNASSLYIHKPVTSQTLQAPMSGYNSEALLPVSNVQPPSELLNFIEKQESYIEQLEKESNFCRDELSTLISKVKDVVSENEILTERSKYGSEVGETYEPLMRSTKFSVTSGPNILFESRISELEAQIAQMNIDYKKLADEHSDLKRKRAFSGGDSAVDNSCLDAYKKQIENLQRDKTTLEDMVKKLQKQITELKDLDARVFSKTQRNRDLVEQASFERSQADIEIRRLKNELERQHERMRELQLETAKRIAEERNNADRRYTYQVDQLGGDLTSQWEQSSKLQLELERMKRIESDLKRELASKNNQIDELKTEIKLKNTAHLSDLTQINAEKHSLEQEITSLRMQVERADRQGKAEVSRLNAENSSLRQRVDRSDADLLHSRRENLRLCDQISNLEKEIALGDIDRDHRPKDVKTVISEMEEKHSKTVQELEAMISEQRQLMEKLTDQCKNLTQKLDDTSHQHKPCKKHVRFQEENIYDSIFDYSLGRVVRDAKIRRVDNGKHPEEFDHFHVGGTTLCADYAKQAMLEAAKITEECDRKRCKYSNNYPTPLPKRSSIYI